MMAIFSFAPRTNFGVTGASVHQGASSLLSPPSLAVIAAGATSEFPLNIARRFEVVSCPVFAVQAFNFINE
jgi:hypothetical protein